MPDPKHSDPKRPDSKPQDDERKRQGSDESGGPDQRKREGGKGTPGNFANDPDRARKTGEKRGQSDS